MDLVGEWTRKRAMRWCWGSIKKVADNLVKSGVSIRDVPELCSALEEANIKTELVMVTAESIKQVKRKMSGWQVPPVPGLMDTHSICLNVDGDLVKRELPCYSECCYNNGVFLLKCDDWKIGFSGVLKVHKLISEREERAPRADTLNALPNETSVNPSNLPDPETAIDIASIYATDGVNSCEQTSTETVTVSENDSNIDVVEISINTVYAGGADNCVDVEPTFEKHINPGSFLAVQYERKYYLAKVLTISGSEMEVSYMSRCKGKWRWGRLATGIVDAADILMVSEEPTLSGKL